MLKSLPVLMYHYISSWPNPIAVDPEIFEGHLVALREAGYKGVGLEEAEQYFLKGWDLPSRSVLITFDDGFLDNYVFAWPLLKKHGHKGLIFTVSGRIVDEEMPRPTLSDVWEGFVDMRGLPQFKDPDRNRHQGLRIRRDLFFSWKEARAMEESGTISIQGHSHKHRSVFTGPSYGKLFAPAARRRTFDRVDADIPLGLPMFERGPALGSRAFLPSEKLMDKVRSLVPQESARAREFFDDPDAQPRVMAELARLGQDGLGRLETDREMELRMRGELMLCRDTITRQLGRPPSALAWPWGKCNETSLKLAAETGFKLLFTTTPGPNPPGKRPQDIHRFKARNKPAKWLMSRVKLYSRPLMARAYGLVRR